MIDDLKKRLQKESRGRARAEELLAGKQEAIEAMAHRIQALELAASTECAEEAAHVQELTSSRDLLMAEQVRAELGVRSV